MANHQGLEEVSVLSGRMERSDEQEMHLAEIQGRPFEMLDGPRFPPSFYDSIETNLTFQERQTAHLNCSIHQLEDQMVSWVRNRDLSILTMGKQIYTADSRFRSLHHSDVWTLEIRDTHQEDSGIYECQVSTQPKMSREIQLNIIVVKAYISEGPVLYIKSGSPVQFTCHVEDKMAPNPLLWYHNERRFDVCEKKFRGISMLEYLGFPYSFSHLFIAETKLSDSGNYSCQPFYGEPANIILHVSNGK
ncbi:uncharacterized protein TNIN_388021 [Trichonephila inaurata madagascariensis]|uniref:Ig-like domain-containing protein n=1 Tax=Trichonephila inaurata madagascariensis TaxID=2747483 RepID=A0A8X7CA07_9ARAC|nr:uncharacterized protein TNIN_388021 [Trichonephila inaurata madagascariensis]